MTTVAVVAHSEKQLGGGLSELRQTLIVNGIDDPLWFEVRKSAKAPKCVRQALKQGADLIFVWGGDGMVQHCADAAAGSGVPIAILPAGTANLLATNLGIEKDLAQAVHTGLHGVRHAFDVGVINGERFAVMAGAGFDARVMGSVNSKAKERFGRLAYLRSSAQSTRSKGRHMKIRVDGNMWFNGTASCVLFGNVGTVTAGLHVFPDAEPDDGVLEVGVVTAQGRVEWLRVLGRIVGRHPEKSGMVNMTHGKKISVEFDKPLPYELDGGARPKVKSLKVRVDPGAIWVCIPDVRTAKVPARYLPTNSSKSKVT